MHTNPIIESFMDTSRAYLSATEHEQLLHAAALLRHEFLDALAQGPGAELSTPSSMRSATAPVHEILGLMFADNPVTLAGLVHEISHHSPSIATYLAQAYASWVIDSYERMGAFE